MARRRRRRRRESGIEQQARLETKVRYGPEREALATLVREADRDLKLGVQAEAGTAAGIIAAVQAAKPEVRKHYKTARNTVDQADKDIDLDLATLGASADRFRAVHSREAGGARQRIAGALASAERELSQRKVDAEAGRAHAVSNRLAEHSRTKRELSARRRSLAGEEGAFKLATVRSLQSAQAEFEQAQAKLEEDIRHNRASEGLQAEGIRQRERASRRTARTQRLKAGGGKGKFSREALSKHQGIVAKISDTNSIAKRIKRDRIGQRDAVRLLSSPRSKDNPYGGFGPLASRAGVALAYTGALPRHLVTELRGQGFLPHRMPRGWRGSHRTGNAISGAPGANRIGR